MVLILLEYNREQLGKVYRSGEYRESTRKKLCKKQGVSVRVYLPLKVGFWWTNSKGEDRWADVKYERLSDV